MSRERTLSGMDVPTNMLWPTVSKDLFHPPSNDTLLPDMPQSHYAASENTSLLSHVDPENLTKKTPLKKGVNWVMTAFILINTALGIGLLNFPSAYDQAGGLISATVMQIVMVFLMMTTMLILCYCSDFNGDNTYHDVLLTMCGKHAQRLAAVSITFTMYFVCIAVLIIIGDQMDSLFLSVFGHNFCHTWYLERHFTIAATSACFILPMCYCKRVDFLGYLGPIGLFAMLYPVLLTCYGFFKIDAHPKIKTRPDDYATIFAVIPVLGLGYQTQECVVPIYSCMRDRTLCNFTKASALAMGLLFVVYSTMGCFGYLTFGSDVAHNIMKMFNADDPVIMVGVGALILKMIVTYPILSMCGRDAVSGLYAELSGLTVRGFEKDEKIRRYVVASLWFSSTLALALFTSSIGIVIRYLGCVATANIYIYPGICLIRVIMKQDPGYESLKSRLLLALGVFITAFGAFCVGIIFIQTIITNDSETPNRICS